MVVCCSPEHGGAAHLNTVVQLTSTLSGTVQLVIQSGVPRFIHVEARTTAPPTRETNYPTQPIEDCVPQGHGHEVIV
ncbi:unnamed protein product [Gadus morhua 'NCC']